MTHDYLSTACLHTLHSRCRRVCKLCDVPCRCLCHSASMPLWLVTLLDRAKALGRNVAP